MRAHIERRAGHPFPFLKSFPVSVERTDANGVERLTGHIVGKVSSDRLILCGQNVGGLCTGEDVTVRMTAQNQALEFRTQVLETLSDGPVLILLAMPVKIHTTDLRDGARLSVFVPADVQYHHGHGQGAGPAGVALIPGRVVNLSRVGCCLSTKRPLAVDQPIRVTFSLPDARSPYRLPAQVRRHVARGREGVFVQGVRFDDGAEHLPVLAELQQWISSNLPFAVRA